MKNKVLFAIMVLFSLSSTAQESVTTEPITPKAKDKEVGVILQAAFGNSDAPTVPMAGLQFKKWKNEHFGIRTMAAYGGFNQYLNTYKSGFITPRQDTLVEKYTETVAGVGILGIGVEAQRQFYKRVVLFAAVELRGGYGSGSEKDYTDVSVYSQNSGSYNRAVTASRDAKVYFIEFAPSIGAKLQFKRWNVGLELSGLNMNSFTINNGINKSGYSNFDAGYFTNRVFFCYNF